ncbi:MAG: N-formylglutamate amidohydrolase [Alphaproteobacteria bacterium]|jgi:predicted N-formylglutamate amidohydrolase|nr:N-formylglutamate amidohydrolase [Alphaproteobacteria bacterium]MBP9867763.1 N-formylglutamate amidohydrolase [Alphaproteobacteria bacterium]
MMSKSFIELNPQSRSSLILLGEHAGFGIPESYNKMGVDPLVFRRDPNFGGDKGVRRILFRAAKELGLPAVMGRQSRILVDLNRSTDHPQLFCETQHGVDVPRNKNLSEAEKQLRLDLYYWPFHHQVEKRIAQSLNAEGKGGSLLTIHSYTPDVAQKAMAKEDAPFTEVDVGILYTRESPLLEKLDVFLKTETDYSFAHNYPYDLKKLKSGSIEMHQQKNGTAGVALEINVKKLLSVQDQDRWADTIIRFLRSL